MTFTQATRTCLRKFATFRGRASRAEYWWFTLFHILAQVVGGLVDLVIGVNGLLYCSVFLLLTLPLLAAACRRLHDTARTGWLLLLGLIPCGGFVLLVFCLQDSDPRTNCFGPPPPRPADPLAAEIAAFHARTPV